jgi:hypothetical protein
MAAVESVCGVLVHDAVNGGWYILDDRTGELYPVDWYLERHRNQAVRLSIIPGGVKS